MLALISEPSIAKAAEVSGISQTSIFRYLQDKAFRQEYQQAKRAMLDGALSDLQRATGRAVATLVEIMESEATPGARVAAARSILSFAIQTAQLEDILKRLETIEDRLNL